MFSCRAPLFQRVLPIINPPEIGRVFTLESVQPQPFRAELRPMGDVGVVGARVGVKLVGEGGSVVAIGENMQFERYATGGEDVGKLRCVARVVHAGALPDEKRRAIRIDIAFDCRARELLLRFAVVTEEPF